MFYLFFLIFIQLCGQTMLQGVQPVQQADRSLSHEKYQKKIAELKLDLPTSIRKIDGPHEKGSMDHIHFKCGYTYSIDGIWEYEKGLNLTKPTKVFIKTIGFPEPQDNPSFESETDNLQNKSPTQLNLEEIEQLTGFKKLPSDVRAVHEPHGNGQQRHIHFQVGERSLNQDGTWESNQVRVLTSEQRIFAEKLGFALGQDIYPRLRPENVEAAPIKFRVMNQEYQAENNCKVTREGLETIRASASGQFSEKNLHFLVKNLPSKKITILSLRRECNGLINGSAASWKLKERLNGQSYAYNIDLPLAEIEEGEKDLLQQLMAKKIKDFKTDHGEVEFPVEKVETERQLVERSGLKFERVPVLDHHYPSPEQTDQIIALFKNLPSDGWIHVHCAAGEGRTSTVMAMFDIIRNHKLSFKDILERQEALGGINLNDPQKRYASHPEKIPAAEKRLEYLNQFHKYCRENPDLKVTWSAWLNKKETQERL